MTHFNGGRLSKQGYGVHRQEMQRGKGGGTRIVQVESTDLEHTLNGRRHGWMPCITTASAHGRYGGKTIAHMVNLVHADGE